MRYPKIHTLWKRERNGKKKGCIIPGEYSEEEVESINRFYVLEKINGMNIRVIYDNESDITCPSCKNTSTVDFLNTHENRCRWCEKKIIRKLIFAGKTDKAEIPPLLGAVLEKYFRFETMKVVFPNAKRVILFGEGYGKKIQEPHGSRYIADDDDFILFDVWVDGYWLEYESMKEIANKFGIKIVPFIGIKSIDQIIEMVKEKRQSEISAAPQTVEGYVCTSYPMMCYRNHRRPIRFKLKVSDYERLAQKEKEERKGTN